MLEYSYKDRMGGIPTIVASRKIGDRCVCMDCLRLQASRQWRPILSLLEREGRACNGSNLRDKKVTIALSIGFIRERERSKSQYSLTNFMRSVARYFPTPLSRFVEMVIFGLTIPNMVSVPILSVNCRWQPFFPSLATIATFCLSPLCRWSYWLSFSDSPHRIWSRYRFSLKIEHSVNFGGCGVWAWSSPGSSVVEPFV